MSSFVDFDVIEFHPGLDSTRPDLTTPLYLSYTATFCLSGLSGCGRYSGVELRFVRLRRPRVKSSFWLSIVLVPMHLCGSGGGGGGGGYFILLFFLKISSFLSSLGHRHRLSYYFARFRSKF